jgi:tyrosine-specific transport protein
VGILSFGAQNVVPTLLKYLGRNSTRTRRAVLLGSLIPLVMYSLWEAVFLGNVPMIAGSSGVDRMQAVNALGSGATNLQVLLDTFSACAIASSMAGAAVSLVDFFADGLAAAGAADGSGKEEEGSRAPLGQRVRCLAAGLALVPPLGLSFAYPDAFLGALENAGLLGGVSLYGVLPAIAVLNLRRQRCMQEDGHGCVAGEGMPGRLGGGDLGLGAILLSSVALLLPELWRLAAG